MESKRQDMKRTLTLFAILFAFYANLFAPDANMYLYKGDTLDQWMHEVYPNYWEWPQHTREAFKQIFRETDNKHLWFPDKFNKPK